MNHAASPLLRVLALLAAIATAATAQESRRYDVVYVEVAADKLEIPTVVAFGVGRFAEPGEGEGDWVDLPKTGGEARRFRYVRGESDLTIKRETRSLFDPDVDQTRMKHDVVVDDFRRRTGRRTRVHCAVVHVAVLADDDAAPPESGPMDAAGMARFLIRALERRAPRTDVGTLLGRMPLSRILPEDERIRIAAAWTPKLEETKDSALRESPWLPALVALGDAAAIGRVAGVVSAERREHSRVDLRDDSGSVTRIAWAPPLAQRIEPALTIAYSSATDPVLRGLAGWTLYEDNPRLFFDPLADDLSARRVVLPGTDVERAEREARLRRVVRIREIGPGAATAAAALAVTVLLLLLLRALLSRVLFR